MNTFKTWNEFTNFQGSYQEKMLIIRASNLGLVNPGANRPVVWVSLVEPKFASESLNYYKKSKLNKETILNSSLVSIIKHDINKITSNCIDSDERQSKLFSLISIFCIKYPEISYNIGIGHISDSLLNVFPLETDSFVMLCHFFINVFPTVTLTQDFYTGKNNSQALMEEIRAFSIYAGKLRPKIVSLMAYEQKLGKETVQDLTIFTVVMEKLAEGWFKSLFSNTLVSNELFRIWDNCLIHGFEFAMRFALVLLSKNESFFRNSLKKEVKNLGAGTTMDSIMLAGNLCKNKLYRKFEKTGIEGLIKKTLGKPSYSALSKKNVRTVVNVENEFNGRLVLMKNFKKQLEFEGFNYETAFSIVSCLESFDNGSNVSRAVFQNFAFKNFSWDFKRVMKFYVIFDQNGNDVLTALSIKIAITLLVEGFDKKLELFFKSMDRDCSQKIMLSDFIHLILHIEENLFNRHTFYQKNICQFLPKPDEVPYAVFVSYIKSDPFFKTLCKNLKSIDTSFVDLIEIPSLEKIIHDDEIMSNLSSPEKSPLSGMSGISDVDIDIGDLNLNSDVEVIGDKCIEVSIMMSEKSLEKPQMPAFINIEEHEESFEVVKDPAFIEEIREKSIRSEAITEATGKETHSETQKNIDLLPLTPNKKERNSCSRLCASQNCLVI